MNMRPADSQPTNLKSIQQSLISHQNLMNELKTQLGAIEINYHSKIKEKIAYEEELSKCMAGLSNMLKYTKDRVDLSLREDTHVNILDEMQKCNEFHNKINSLQYKIKDAGSQILLFMQKKQQCMNQIVDVQESFMKLNSQLKAIMSYTQQDEQYTELPTEPGFEKAEEDPNRVRLLKLYGNFRANPLASVTELLKSQTEVASNKTVSHTQPLTIAKQSKRQKVTSTDHQASQENLLLPLTSGRVTSQVNSLPVQPESHGIYTSHRTLLFANTNTTSMPNPSNTSNAIDLTPDSESGNSYAFNFFQDVNSTEPSQIEPSNPFVITNTEVSNPLSAPLTEQSNPLHGANNETPNASDPFDIFGVNEEANISNVTTAVDINNLLGQFDSSDQSSSFEEQQGLNRNLFNLG